MTVSPCPKKLWDLTFLDPFLAISAKWPQNNQKTITFFTKTEWRFWEKVNSQVKIPNKTCRIPMISSPNRKKASKMIRKALGLLLKRPWHFAMSKNLIKPGENEYSLSKTRQKDTIILNPLIKPCDSLIFDQNGVGAPNPRIGNQVLIGKLRGRIRSIF